MKFLRKFNESFSSAPELKEALEIYSEELPFDMANITIQYKPAGVKQFKNGSRHVNEYYIVSYEHIDSDLNDKIKEFDEYNAGKRHTGKEPPLNYETLIKDVEDQVENAFKKFARKYDMEYDVDNTVVDLFSVPDDNVTVSFRLNCKSNKE